MSAETPKSSGPETPKSSGPKPATFGDMGKSAKDLLNKDFTTDLKLELETVAANGVTFESYVKQSNKGDINGELKVKGKDPAYGMTVQGVVNTANTVSGKVTFEDQIAKGLKVTAEAQQVPDMAKLGLAYKHDHFTTSMDIKTTSRFASFNIDADATLGYEGFVLGSAVTYNTDSNDLTRMDTGLAYNQKDLSVNLGTKSKGDLLAVSVYHKVKPGLAAGADFSYSRANTAQTFNLVGRYDLDGSDKAFWKGKISDKGVVSVAYGQNLRPGMKAVVSATVDTKNLNNGPAHKVGLTLVLKE